MGLKMLVLFSTFLLAGNFGYTQTLKQINQESVSNIKKGTTTKMEIRDWFGTPTGNHVSSSGDFWLYSQATSQLMVNFDTAGIVFSYTFQSGDIAPKERTLQERSDFVELIRKVQEDKSLLGTFMYKESQAIITDDKEYKMIIGKFIAINWKTYSAYFHNTSGDKTKARFNQLKNGIKKYGKAEKNKYCASNYCWELRNDGKLPYVMSYMQSNEEMKEIK
jgi:hypothetical protein